jgi:hypothetical protein
MKKTLITLTTTLIAAAAFGQGSVNFANSSATAVSNSLTMARVTTAAFRVSLYFLPDTGVPPSNETFDLAGMVVATTNFSLAGVFNGGAIVVPAPFITPAGGNGWFQVRAWEIAFGSTYAEAAANTNPQGGRLAQVGQSNIMKVDTGDPTTVPAGTPTTLLSAGLKSFFVTPVPEPSTLALGALGLSALLFLRRRK